MGSMFGKQSSVGSDSGATSFNQDIGNWDVSNVIGMSSMFDGAEIFNQDLSKWCVTNITSEPSAFSASSALTDANKPKWGTCPNVSNDPPFYLDDNGVTIKARDWVTVGTTGELNGVTYTAVDNTTLKEMAEKFSNFDLEDDDDLTKVVTTLVTDMYRLFWYSQTFNQVIGSWDVSNVTNMSEMFSNAKVFNKDIGNWDVSKVNDMAGMFYYCSSI